MLPVAAYSDKLREVATDPDIMLSVAAYLKICCQLLLIWKKCYLVAADSEEILPNCFWFGKMAANCRWFAASWLRIENVAYCSKTLPDVSDSKTLPVAADLEKFLPNAADSEKILPVANDLKKCFKLTLIWKKWKKFNSSLFFLRKGFVTARTSRPDTFRAANLLLRYSISGYCSVVLALNLIRSTYKICQILIFISAFSY